MNCPPCSPTPQKGALSQSPESYQETAETLATKARADSSSVRTVGLYRGPVKPVRASLGANVEAGVAEAIADVAVEAEEGKERSRRR